MLLYWFCQDPCGHVFSLIFVIYREDLRYLYRDKELKEYLSASLFEWGPKLLQMVLEPI